MTNQFDVIEKNNDKTNLQRQYYSTTQNVFSFCKKCKIISADCKEL